jgi:hypothetical protein
LEEEISQSKAAGSISAKDYPKALSGLKKDFPEGITACGADALRYGLCCNDVTSKKLLQKTIVFESPLHGSLLGRG